MNGKITEPFEEREITKLLAIETESQSERKRAEYRLDKRNENLQGSPEMVRVYQGPRDELQELVTEINETLDSGYIESYSPDNSVGEIGGESITLHQTENREKLKFMTEAFFQSLKRENLQELGENHFYDPSKNVHIAYDFKEKEGKVNLALYGDNFAIQDYIEELHQWIDDLV